MSNTTGASGTTNPPYPGLLASQHLLLKVLSGKNPDELRSWLTGDPATQGSYRVRYNLAAHYAATDCDRALRNLRIAATTGTISTAARMDPSLAGLRRDVRFEETLAWADTPRLTDLRPLRPIGFQLRAAGAFTPFQLAAQARSAADRAVLASSTKVSTDVLEAAARFADLAVVLNGDPDTLYLLWTVNVRSVCDLAHADVGQLAREISVDQFTWEAPLHQLLEMYRRSAIRTGPSIEPYLSTCPQPHAPGSAEPDHTESDDDRLLRHCCSCVSHSCRGEHEGGHEVTQPHRPGTCWIHSFPKPSERLPADPTAEESQPTLPRSAATTVRCHHPRTIDASPPAPARPAATAVATDVDPALIHEAWWEWESERVHRGHGRHCGHEGMRWL